MKRFFCFLNVLIVISSYSYSQEINVNKESYKYNIENNGNTTVVFSQKFNAQQWQELHNYINNQALMKSYLVRIYPNRFLDDFKFENNDADRECTISFNIYGYCDVDKKGKWTIKTGLKNPEITKLSDSKNEYMIVYTNPMLNTQQTHIFKFPSKAKNIKIEKDAFDYSYFEFEMPSSSFVNSIFLWTGLILICIGAALFIRLFLRQKQKKSINSI